MTAGTPRTPGPRRFETSRRVRLADADPTGRLRLDALARFLQDIGNDDTADAGHDAATPWVTRRTTITVDAWPRIGERLEVTTWCGGIGSHFAERRTTLRAPSGTIEAAATWVHVDEVTGRPQRLPQWFHDTYASAAEGRKITARLNHGAPPADAVSQPWPIRWADLDVIGHVNNAAYWEAVEEVCHQRGLVPTFAEVEYAGGIDPGDEVQLLTAGDAVWLVVDGTVRGSALVR
ncbi:MAG TPA: acyl-ACP thioesterase domain-containing protein [Acidimicrobiales bacterium]|nr:acyl-ACP thioesterase domain-containing protein [Acidimicrobiales bacterium]